MPKKQTIAISRTLSFIVGVIGVASLTGAMLFAHTMKTIELDAGATAATCDASLEMCMRFSEQSPECSACVQSKGAIRTTVCQTCVAAKALCQNDYSACTDPGDSIHPW